MTPAETVTAMIRAIEAKDLATATALMADDVEYDNVPMRKVHGRAGVTASLEPFLARFDEVEWRVHHQAAEGDVVMNERTDRFGKGGAWAEVRVAGLFVVHGGLITLWRDYFDLAEVQAALAG